MARESTGTLIYDAEFGELAAAASDARRYLTDGSGENSLAALIERGRSLAPLAPPAQPARTTVLTSGTTGTPKGARREPPARAISSIAAILSRIPLRAGETTVIPAPLFHSWGLAHLTIGLALRSTLVLRRRFDPLATLQDIDGHRATALVVVPVMLQRMLELPPAELAALDLTSLRVIAASGSALSGDLARRTMDEFGDVLYNLYGSTEVAWATIAGPHQLHTAPGTAGTPPHGTRVHLLDADGRPVPRGHVGRIFVSNGLEFEGYTGGGSKQVIDGLMATGDVGHFDAAGRLFVDGRDDDMIVSGGENVFPREVEELIASHPDVAEAAVVGVPDEDFGQRLAAFVVPRAPGVLDEQAVMDHVRANLARFKVPREVRFVETLPRNETGKVLHRVLKDGSDSGAD
jgi:fatty-acyl-CoA synthase